MICALIVAAGQGTRMGNQMPKQYMPLAGEPVLAYSLKAFNKVKQIEKLILVAAADQIDNCRTLVVEPCELDKQISIVAGGKRRQDSVYNGLRSIEKSRGIVLIHDGARPMVSCNLIEACIEGVRKWGACVPGIVPADTLKRIDEDGFVQDTLPRQHLRRIQTPQGFDIQMILKAHENARQRNSDVTDDAALVEQLGKPIRVIPGETDNIKITTPQDMAWAESFIRSKQDY